MPTTITTRTGPEIRAELDSLLEWRDSYARGCAQAVVDNDPAAATYAAKFADCVTRITELRDELRGSVELHGISAYACTTLLNLRKDDDSDSTARAWVAS